MTAYALIAVLTFAYLWAKHALRFERAAWKVRATDPSQGMTAQ